MDGRGGNWRQRCIDYFQMVWNSRKARGLLAQEFLVREFDSGRFRRHRGKMANGCWLTSPKSEDFYKFRMATFVHGEQFATKGREVDPEDMLGHRAVPFYATAEFLDNAGVGVSYAFARSGSIDVEAILRRDYSGMDWRMLLYKNERLVIVPGEDLFSTWGSRGRVVYKKKKWDNDELVKLFAEMPESRLGAMLLNELFYIGYMKSILKKPTNDPYDVDAFIISKSQKHVFPVEVKEKFPATNNRGDKEYFGIDAGRIMMLLRLCLPNDTDAFYIVRETDENGKFVEWKYAMLSDILMKSSWNLVRGGIGMGGSDTQTVRVPYGAFDQVTESTFDENSLRRADSLPDRVKEIASGYGGLHRDRFRAPD